MHKLCHVVEHCISEALPEKLAVIMDRWSDKSTHYVAVFALYVEVASCSSSPNLRRDVLLSISPMVNEGTQCAVEHYKLLVFVLSVFGKDMSCAVAVVGDNCSTNRAMERRIGPTFMGLYSHRFNLFVQDIIGRHTSLVGKVSKLMKKLSYNIPAYDI